MTSEVKLAGAALVFLLSCGGAQAQRWIPSHGESCAYTCGGEDRTVWSGRYKGGEPIYVCRADPGGEGDRAGYNLSPSWDRVCTVGYGGRETGVPRYDCLCRR
jgi:hypothetical protein